MRRGWQGDPPRSEDEARDRMLTAAVACVQRLGPDRTGLSDVAAELGVTRQTVYRVFPSADELLTEAAERAARSFLEQVSEHGRSFPDPVDSVVETFAFALEQLPQERYLSLLLSAHGGKPTGVISVQAVSLATGLLQGYPIAWQTDPGDGLSEFLLRMLNSFVTEPDPFDRTPGELRTFLRLCIGPVVHSCL